MCVYRYALSEVEVNLYGFVSETWVAFEYVKGCL